MDNDTAELKKFFDRSTWPSSMQEWKWSGFNLVQEVSELRPRFVLDVGCGHNEFKGRIPNLVGIDIANEAADWVCDMLDAPIAPRSVDVILALGSVNFGSADDIDARLVRLASWLTPTGRLIMRGNPGVAVVDSIDFFEWSEIAVVERGTACGLRLVDDIHHEHIDGPWGERIHRLVWTYALAGDHIQS